MITLNDVSLYRGTKCLLEHSNAMIHAGQKLGLVGKNGCGKSSLFSALRDPGLFADGVCEINQKISIAYIVQEMPEVAISAVEYAAQGHAAYAKLSHQLQIATAEGKDSALVEIHNKMADFGLYAIPSKAEKTLIGLGFSQKELTHPVHSFSGGWRMRLNLARVILSDADLLLLDEPTNHLDLESIVWLERWLKEAPNTVLVISHDRQFLDNTVTHIVHIEHQALHSYTGNYSDFERLRAEKLALQTAAHAKQVKQRAHLQSFVDRFRYKASKAKQAQSRLKMLEKLDAALPLRTSAAVHFEFLPAERLSNPILSARNLNLGYQDALPVLKHVSFSLSHQDRIGLIGPNGAGKSTLIKFLAGQLTPLSGHYDESKQLKIGYFAQHLLDQLDISSHALQVLMRENKQLSEADARKLLGHYQFGSEDIFRPIASLSGGERARLVLALIIQKKPNVLLLDEPTNHLDLEVRDALNMALQRFSGATVIVSHDRFFLSSVSDQLWLVYDGEVQPFNGSLEAYQKWYGEQRREQEKAALSMQSQPEPQQRKESQRQMKQFQKELKKNESALEIKLQRVQQIDQDMATCVTDFEQLNALSKERDAVQKEIEQLEHTILSLMDALDQNTD